MLQQRPGRHTEFGRDRAEYDFKSQSVSDVGGKLHMHNGPFSDIFPCSEPVNPQFKDFAKRLQTFNNESWHRNSHVPSPDRLAEAGLFYLGERDRCKCHYCNGGLQNWEPGDDPMIEHAKYFPQCEYVLQHKGPGFVADLNTKYPNLSRPGISNGSSQIQETTNSIQPTWNYVSNSQREHRESPSAIQTGAFLIPNGQQRDRELPNPSINMSAREIVVADEINQLDLKAELQSAMDETICLLCRNQERSCVFMNCGHLCCCYECGKAAKQCPICKCPVLQTIKIFKT